MAGVYGIILLPDNYWDNPINHFFQTSSQQELMPHYSGNDIYFSTERKLSMLQNNFTKETWKKFEEAGAIFLPTSNYWTSSVNEPKTRLNKDNVLQLKVKWENLYGELPTGQYRIVKKVNNQYFSTEFIIK